MAAGIFDFGNMVAEFILRHVVSFDDMIDHFSMTIWSFS